MMIFDQLSIEMENCSNIYWNGSYRIFVCKPCPIDVKKCAIILALENMKFCINSCSLGEIEDVFNETDMKTNDSEMGERHNSTTTFKSSGKAYNSTASNASNHSNFNTSVLNTSVLNTSIVYERKNQTISATMRTFSEEGWNNFFVYIAICTLIISLLGMFTAKNCFKKKVLIWRRRSISSVLPFSNIESMTHGTHDSTSISDMVIQNVIDDLICSLSHSNIKSVPYNQNVEQPSAVEQVRKQEHDTMCQRSRINHAASEENLRKNIVKSTLYSVIDHVVKNLNEERLHIAQDAAIDGMTQARSLALLRLRKRHLIRQRKRRSISQRRTNGLEYAANHLLLRNSRIHTLPQSIDITRNEDSDVATCTTGGKRKIKIRELFQSAPSGDTL